MLVRFPSQIVGHSLHQKMGCYVEGIAKDTVGGKDVTAHIFECDQTYPKSSLLV